MRAWIVVLGVLLLSALATPDAVAMWSLGANTGLTIVSPEGGGDATTVVAWPANSLAEQPGLRIGSARAGSPHEFFFNTGFFLLSGGGSSSTLLQTTANYQYSLGSEGSTRPYLTAGGGLLLVSFDSGGFGSGTTAVSGLFGGGVGLRNWVAEDHGSIRIEGRYDRLTRGEDNGAEVIEPAGLISLMVGFDLWFR